MQFVIKRDALLKSLTLVQGIIEKKNTLPILSNVLLDAKDGKLSIIATDLDLVFYDEISEIQINKDGATTTSATILYDILRKISDNSDIKFDLKNENKLNLITDNSDFNLLCLPTDNFPNFADNFEGNEISFNKSKLLTLLNKTKISISSDDTRHYLNGIYLHLTEAEDRTYLTGVATDSHRLSSSSIEIDTGKSFHSIILPKKTVFQLCNLILDTNEKVLVQTSESKIQFKIGKTKLISKVIDGKFPDYRKVVPVDNDKTLTVISSDFVQAIERVTTVSLDKKEGVKLILGKNNIKFSVNSTNSGEGSEVIKSNFTGEEMTVSFNSKYLTDIASEVEDKNLKISLKDPMSPVLIEDMSDKNSYYVVMPMKI
jgi:DNA polymerase-3 subunit beta|tara:strand:- start:1001 stop:2116 length:1116 start_codon:yes stop_codon:yes gene_type:complete